MADKINGGGGFFGEASKFIDRAKDIASDGIDTINKAVDEYTEDAKQGVDDAAGRLHDVVDGMEESVDTLKSMGAGAKRKLDSAMDTVGEATKFASDSPRH